MRALKETPPGAHHQAAQVTAEKTKGEPRPNGYDTAPRSLPHNAPTHFEYSDLAAAYERLLGRGGARDWFAEGAIEGHPIIVFTGPEKQGKSWALMHLACATIVGGAWLGTFPIRRPGHVVVVENEYGQDEYIRRVLRICRAEGWDLGQVIAGLHHYEGAFALLDDSELKPAAKLIEDAKRWSTKLTIVDPLRNYVPDENDTANMVRALNNAGHIRNFTGSVVATAHHLNKQGNQSGARAIRTRADLLFDGTDTDNPVYSAEGRCLRQCDRIRNPFSLAITHDNDEDDTIAKTLVRAVFQGDATQPAATTTASSRAHERVDAHLRASGPLNKTQISAALKMSGETLNAAIDVLKTEGRLRFIKSKRGYLLEAISADAGDVCRRLGIVVSSHDFQRP